VIFLSCIYQNFQGVPQALPANGLGWGKGNINSGGAFCFAKYGLKFR